MGEYIIHWDGIGASFSDMLRDRVPLVLWPKRIRQERLREPVVRCRDCKHFTPKGTHKFENGKTNADYCTYVRGWMLQITPNGFCAWGERREP